MKQGKTAGQGRNPGGLRIARRHALRLILAGPLAGLAGCNVAVPGQGPPPELFRLTPKSTFNEGLPRVDWQLVLEEPQANAGIDTTRITLQRAPLQIEYYARAQWSDRAPQMVQTLMIESFENSDRIVAVGRDVLGLRADFILKTELREFQAEYFHPGPPRSHIAIAARLVQMPRRAIIGSTTFEASQAATGDSVPAVIDAFDDALGKVLRRMVEWTLTTGDQARRSG